jgi:hypothetical protein
MALNVKNYFFDLPLDIQEHILNINRIRTLKTCFNALYNNRWDNKNKDYKKRKFWSLDLTTIKIITIEKMTRFKKYKEGLKLIKEEKKEQIKKILNRKKELKKYIKEREEIIFNEGEAALYKNKIYDDVMTEHDAKIYELENIYYKIELEGRHEKEKIFYLELDYIKNYYLKFDYDDEIYNRYFKNEMIKKYRY